MPSNVDKMLEVIKTMPGSTTAEIIELTGISSNSASSQLSVMLRSGRIIKQGKGFHLETGATPVPKKFQMKPETKLALRIHDLELEIQELLEWKSNAIKQYPDLGVKPHVMAARKIAMDYYQCRGDTQKVQEIRSGKCDEAPFMHMIIAAMS